MDELVPSAEVDHDRHAAPTTKQLAPNPIRALEQTVINQIAAGEIIHRPANALKELIENSLDAGSTSIKVTLKEGGLKVLQVQDNGSGVRPEDLPLLCQRFATSKLREFSDLSSMSTFGFRGEALASLSYVCASMSVVTKTKQESCAYKASYLNGALAAPKPGQSSAPRPCAGTDGTTITAESLFYNTPMRLRALRSASDEYNRCLDVVSKYAVHYAGRGVGFVCKKASSNAADISTAGSPSMTTLDAIRALHGSGVAKELVRLKPVKNERLDFKVEGWISGANWSAKRSTLLCFINNRLVDCPSLKRAMETLYSSLLPKGGHPWLYISLDIEPSRLDVNVHPTKREVHFLDEDDIVESVCAHAELCLAGTNTSRNFKMTQALLPGASEPPSKRPRMDNPAEPARPTQSLPTSSQRGYPQHLVRVDANMRTLDSMFGFSASQSTSRVRPSSSSSRVSIPSSDPIVIEDDDDGDNSDGDSHVGNDAQDGGADDLGTAEATLIIDNDGEESMDLSSDLPALSELAQASSPLPQQEREPDEPPRQAAAPAPPPPPPATDSRPKVRKRLRDSECTLTSVRELRAEIQSRRHGGMTEVLQGHTFVGVAALEYGLSLVQHMTRLYLVRHDRIIEEFAYQLVLRQFGAFQEVRLEPPPKISELAGLAVDSAQGWAEAGLSKKDILERVESRLLSHAEMLAEYFSIRFDAEARTLQAVPKLLPLHGTDAVQPQRLGALLLRLATEVNWEEEKPCFEGVVRELARASVPCIDGLAVRMVGERDVEGVVEEERDREEWDRQAWIVQHAWFAQMGPQCCGFIVPKTLLDEGALIQVANLPDLYRVFERC